MLYNHQYTQHTHWHIYIRVYSVYTVYTQCILSKPAIYYKYIYMCVCVSIGVVYVQDSMYNVSLSEYFKYQRITEAGNKIHTLYLCVYVGVGEWCVCRCG